MISEDKYKEILRRYFGTDCDYGEPDCANGYADVSKIKCANCIFQGVECSDNPYRRIEEAMEDIREAKAMIAAIEKWDSKNPATK